MTHPADSESLATAPRTDRRPVPSAAGPSAIPTASRQQPLPLSPQQQGMWFLDQLQPDCPQAYHVVLAYELRGPLNVEALRRALDRIVARHEALRTRIGSSEGRGVQQVMPATIGCRLVEHDLRSVEGPRREQTARQLCDEAASRPFALARDTLIRAELVRLDMAEHRLVVTIHHIVFDGWSTSVFLHELRTLYQAFSQGGDDPLPPPQIQYADYAVWQRAQLEPAARGRHLAFWRNHLQEAPALIELHTDRPRPPLQSLRGGRVPAAVPPACVEGLRALGKRHGVTMFMTVLAAWSVVLSRLAGQDGVVIGTPMANRPHPQLHPLVGYFVNTLPLHLRLGGDPSVAALLQQVKTAVIDAQDHQDLPFHDLVDALQPVRSAGHHPLFQVALTLLDARSSGSLELQDLDSRPIELAATASQFDLTLTLADDGASIAGHLEFASDLFDRSSAERFAAYFANVLLGMVRDDQCPVTRLRLMDGRQRAEVLARLNPRPCATQPQPLIHEAFEACAARSPQATAVVFEGRTLSYRELNERANRLAHRLIRLGVRPDDRVALCLERGSSLVVAVLGILKAGAGYVPIDPDYPADLVSYVLKDSQPQVLVTQPEVAARLPLPGIPVVLLGCDMEDGELATEPANDPRPDSLGLRPNHLAYVIYTSGSTGQPKGVMVGHAQVARLFSATQPWFGFCSDDTWTLFHSVAFDFSVWEMWGALLHGGKLVVVPKWCAQSPQDFYRLLCEQRVTVLNQTPSAFMQLIEARNASSVMHGLRQVIFGGEALEPHALLPWIHSPGAERTRLVNMYGITETTVHVTFRVITPADVEGRHGSLIGEPIPDLRLYLLDRWGEPVPYGAVGEIHVGGAGLARAYLNRPTLTKERFVPDRFGDGSGTRLYKSGDLARLLPDGEVEYVGRNDAQVKIRGFRIELGEIEAKLASCPGVHHAVVLVTQATTGEKRLVAYVVPRPEATPAPAELRERLAAELPQHMLPSAFVMLQRLPLTANGKLDRHALPPPTGLAVARAGDAPPHAGLESEVAQAWCETLGIERVSREDDFFALGGHSMLAVQLVARLCRQFGWNVAVRDLLSSPTLRAFAAAVRDRQSQRPAGRLTPIRARGPAPALFLVHSGEGEIGYARELAQWLDDGVPVYGLGAAGFLPGEVPSRSVADMASRYVEAIQELLPEGPFRLAGWSGGGTIACEMAAQLIDAGRPVEFLGLIDTSIDYQALAARLEAGRRGEVDFEALRHWLVPALAADLEQRLKAWLPGRPPEQVFAQCQAWGIATPGIDGETFAAHLRVQSATLGALLEHRLRALPLKCFLYSPDQPAPGAMAAHWRPLFADGVVETRVGGDHYSIVRPPHAQALAAAMSRHLAQPSAARA